MSSEQSNKSVDSILDEVRGKLGEEQPKKPAAPSDREVNSILRELGLDPRKQKKQSVEPILLSFPGAETPPQQPAPPPDDGADSEPFVEDLVARREEEEQRAPVPGAQQEEEDELPTLELPTIQDYADAEAQKQEEERRRIMEQAQREAQNTIHNAAQFAMQMEISRQMAAINGEELPEEDEPEAMGNNLFGEVDDQFRAFFGKTVVVDRAAVEQAVSGHKKKGLFGGLFRKNDLDDTASLTGEFDAAADTFHSGFTDASLELPKLRKNSGAQLEVDVLTLNVSAREAGAASARPRRKQEIDVPLEDERSRGGVEEQAGIDEYSTLSDAPAVAQNLATMRRTRLLRTVFTGVLALLLTYLGLAARGPLPLPDFLDPAQKPLFFLLLNFVLLACGALGSITTMLSGFMGLAQDPTTDSFCSLAVAGALIQNIAYLFQSPTFDPAKITLFTPVAALLLFGNALGKWLQIRIICRNFDQVSSGSEHAAAFLMPQMQLVKRLCAGLGEPQPVLLVSRPTALVKGFLSQSFSARLYDAMAQQLSYVMAGAGVVCAVICGIKAKSVFPALTGLAGALCLAAPLACTLVYAVPAQIMQNFASKHKAIIPGPSAIQALGRANTVLLNAQDLFPIGSVRLHGIKTFEKERIDVAILYAASMLATHCDTLKDIFLGIIQNNTKMLYNVESVTAEAGYGFTGWIEHNRVIIGNREMMRRHDIEIPSLDYEQRYTKNGKCAPIYLAVSGKLFGMFVVSYRPSRAAAQILNRLTRSGISVIVQSDDFNVTSELVSATYRIGKGTVKVLSQPECDALNAETAYRATSEGVMIHDGTCASFLGGMRAASCAADGEHLARNVQAGAIIFSAVLSAVLAVFAALGGLSLGIVLLYQIAWAALTVALPLLKKP